MGNNIKLIVRALLPLLVGTIACLTSCLMDVMIHRVFNQVRELGPHDDAGIRAAFLMVPFVVLLSPLFLLIHGGICWLSRKYRISIKYFAIVLSLVLVLFLITVSSFERISFLSILESVKFFSIIFVPLLLYVYMLNYTRDAAFPKEKNIFTILWITTCLMLIISNLLFCGLKGRGIITSNPFFIYSLPLVAYGWFGIIWILKGQKLKWLAATFALLSIIYVLNMQSAAMR